MEVLLTVIIVEHLTGTGKQRLDMFPYPRSPIADDTQPHLIFGNHAGVLDLLERLAQLRLMLHLMPTEQIHDAIVIDQRKAKALGIAPLAFPLSPLGPGAPLARTTPPGAIRTGGH